MVKDLDFSPIRPYEDHEVHAVVERLKNEKTFLELVSFLYPAYSIDLFLEKLTSIRTVREFQSEIVYPYMMKVLEHTTEGITLEGTEKLDPKQGYLFISNHRDIILDSGILNLMFVEKGLETTEIAIGDNLLIFPWITDLVKLNRSFVVRRNLPGRQMIESSMLLSQYIRHTITQKGRGIWIAQREGRSKDGDDRTQASLLKMLNMSGSGDFAADFRELKIVPLSVSYELDPCDHLKAYQFQLKRDKPDYQKSKGEDLHHMGAGLRGRKGRVHFTIGTPIDAEIDAIAAIEGRNEQLQALAETIDRQIHANYKLWPGNFVACDLLEPDKNEFADQYTAAEKEKFVNYLNEHISRVKNPDHDFMFRVMLEMYANPVRNFYKKS